MLLYNFFACVTGQSYTDWSVVNLTTDSVNEPENRKRRKKVESRVAKVYELKLLRVDWERPIFPPRRRKGCLGRKGRHDRRRKEQAAIRRSVKKWTKAKTKALPKAIAPGRHGAVAE